MAEQRLTAEYTIKYITALRDEWRQGKHDRMDQNQENFASYHLKHDFSHKIEGQSKEVLSKVRNATESSKSFFQQALSDLEDWYSVVTRDGTDGFAMPIRPEEMKKLMNYMLGRADYFSHIGAQTQLGLLGSLAISKVHGTMVSKPVFKVHKKGKGKTYEKSVVVEDNKTWELRFADVRQEDFYRDTSGNDIGEIEEAMVDLHIVKQLATGDNAIYDKAVVDDLKPWGGVDIQEGKKSNETGQNISQPQMRPQIKITEYWGTIVDHITGDVLCENCVATMANDMHVIRMPTENPYWHQRRPNVAAALIEVANSVWGVALMDAGVKHNKALIELFNLMLDAAMKAVWGINQLRTDVLVDSTQITDRIKWGQNLHVSAALPIGGKVLETVVSGEIPQEVITMFNLLNQETLSAMKTNDLRMGAQSFRAVKATEVVAAENAITSEFQGVAKNFEEKKVQPELELACWTICQNWDLIDKEIFISLFGKQRGEELSALDPQDVFVATVNGYKFNVFGISLTLRRNSDFRKWTTLLQTIGASEALIEAFLQKYSFEKLLGEIMSSLDLDKTKIESGAGGEAVSSGATQSAPTLEQPGGAPGASPATMSQIPAAQGMPAAGGLAAVFANGGMGVR